MSNTDIVKTSFGSHDETKRPAAVMDEVFKETMQELYGNGNKRHSSYSKEDADKFLETINKNLKKRGLDPVNDAKYMGQHVGSP